MYAAVSQLISCVDLPNKILYVFYISPTCAIYAEVQRPECIKTWVLSFTTDINTNQCTAVHLTTFCKYFR
jgi:hypothetical protein